MRTRKQSGLFRGSSRSTCRRGAARSTIASSSAPCVRRQAVMSKELGGTPYRCLKLREKSDDEEKPQARAIVVSDGGRGWAQPANL